jgi:pimeloyl-ACP methyl ester carboxylesterase
MKRLIELTISAAVLGLLLAATAAAKPYTVDPCPEEVEGAVCGHVDVPFDRGDPSAGTIPIAFEKYEHTGPGPAKSAIMVNFGGPGVSTTTLRDVALFWFDALRDRHDLVLVDDRGRGRSGAIDCPDYQHGTGPLLDVVGACADQLGAAATRYSTAEIAHDYDAVRSALGYDKIDFVGTSYGGADANAYATRFGNRLRTLVLNGAWGMPFSDPFVRPADGASRIVERVGTICARSRACGRSASEAVDAARGLVRTVRRAPVVGTGSDGNGEPHEVSVDPEYLLVHILDDADGWYLTPGEIPAAAEALERGDAVPLLRLAAEGDFPISGDSGEPSEYSAGAFSATFCLDQPWPWSQGASLTERQAQWAEAVAAAADGPFAPFRAEELMFGIYGMSPFCLAWPQAGSRPVVEPGARYPNVPTLALHGEYDTNVGKVAETAALYPNSTYVEFVGTGHTPLAWSDCALAITVEFIRTREVGDTSCASRSRFRHPGVTAFPRRAAESPAATPGRGNRAGTASRRVARVAADAALDALKRSFRSGGHGAGLRGGSFDSADFWTITLSGARWTEDVAVSGTVHWSFDGGPFDAELQVDGPGGRDGTLHLKGGWLIPGSPRSIRITGTLAGEWVVARVPSS